MVPTYLKNVLYGIHCVTLFFPKYKEKGLIWLAHNTKWFDIFRRSDENLFLKDFKPQPRDLFWPPF